MKRRNFMFLMTIFCFYMWWSVACDSDHVVASESIEASTISSSQEKGMPEDLPTNVNIQHNVPDSDNLLKDKISDNSETTKKETAEKPNTKIPKFTESIRKARRKDNSDLVDRRKGEASESDQTKTDIMIKTKINGNAPGNVEPSEKSAGTDDITLESSAISLDGEKVVSADGVDLQTSSHVVEVEQQHKEHLLPSTTTATTEGNEQVVQGQLHHSEAMPSFDEWKKMMLAEQEKEGGQKLPLPGIPGKKASSPKRRRNYASYQCGAKIVATNPEAEGASRILNELVDEYMLNPCKANIWFVMELCESVQASQIELANFELFSSRIKDFAVYSSDNFPTRDWILLGTFTAAEQRVLQSFPLKQEGFGKFIKIEIQSNYGKEHYCPLSLVHLFGTSMVDEYEELETQSEQLIDDELDRLDLPAEDKARTNLLGTATDAVYNIIKKAAQVLSPHQAGEGEPDGTVEQNVSDSERCKSVDNNCGKVKSSKLNASNIPPSDFLVSVGSIHRTLFQHMKHCGQCMKETRPSYHSVSEPECRFLQAALGPVLFTTICDWFRDHHLETMYHAPIVKDRNTTTSTSHKPTSPPPSVIQVIIEGSTAESTTMPTFQDIVPTAESLQTSSTETSELPVGPKVILSTSTSPEPKLTEPEIAPTKTLSKTEDLKVNVTEVIDSSPIPDSNILLGEENQLLSERISPPNVSPIYDFDSSEIISSSFMTLPTPETVAASDNNETGIIPDSADEIDVSIAETATIATSTIEIAADEFTEGLKTIEDSTMKMEYVTSSGAQSSASQKESVFVRMNNRIKALELNMSLSSQYLQELSQRYRRQMEEMQRAFNRTIATLNDTAKKAAERDLKQQETIASMQSQLANLTTAVEMLIRDRASFERRMTERHLCIIVAELIFIVTMVSLCVRRISFMVPAPPMETTTSGSPSGRKRHSSADVSSPRVAKVKRRSSSEEIVPSNDGFRANQPSVMPPPPPPPLPMPKAKKRNRKKKGMRRSLSNPAMSPAKGATSLTKATSKGEESAAGIIFSHADAKRTYVESTHICENCNKNQTAVCELSNHTENKRKNDVPFKNLTNGHLHNLPNDKLEAPKRRDKFSFKKILRLQKRESI